MGSVTHLRYVGMAVPDYDTAVNFYRGVWGLSVAETDSGLAFLAAEASPEPYVYRIRQAEDGQRRLDVVGFSASDRTSVDELAAELGSAGIRLVSEPDSLTTPGGGYGFRFFDPDGRVVEVAAEVAERPCRQLEEREAIPLGLSHVVFNTTQRQVLESFDRDRLGFRLSDWLGDGFMSFWRCDAAHHSVAMMQMPFTSVNHVAFEVASIDDMLRASGRVLGDGRAKPQWGPGRHSAGDNTFYYFFDPVGNVSEYTSDVQRVPEDWQPRQHTTPDVWQVVPIPDFRGQPDAPPEQLPQSDPGLFVAPPV